MKPRRVPGSNAVYRLEGGNEDSDLWAERAVDHEGYSIIISVWDLSQKERKAIAEDGTIELAIWGKDHPPVSLAVGAPMKVRKNKVEK